MGLMLLPICHVAGGQFWVTNHEKIFSVRFLSGLREIERPRQNYLPVNDHDFVVGDCVLRVDEHGDSRVGHEVRRGILLGALALIQDHANGDTTFERLNKCLSNWGISDRVGSPYPKRAEAGKVTGWKFYERK